MLLFAMLFCMCASPAFAAKRVKPIGEQLAARKVLETPQTKAIRLGEDGKPRVIITSDLEIDDMNSFIHQCLFFNEIDLVGVVVSGSFCHFTGDGVHVQKEVMDHIQNREEGALEMASFRPQPLNWLPDLWTNEYAEAYEFLSQNAEGYPSPEYLVSITKIGNVQFEGDVREDTEGSDWIKAAILDDDERNLYILSWGGFNTVARALLSIYEEFAETEQWDAVYEKVCSKVLISGNGQDWTFNDFIADKYPDLVLAHGNCGYAGYSAALNAQPDALYTFQAPWLKENIKFDHGSLMSLYKTVNDGQHIDGEEDKYQFGETNIVYDKEYNDFDFIAEGDSSGIIGLFSGGFGLRGFENGAFGSYGGRYGYTKANGEDAGYLSTLPGGIVPTAYVNPETNNIEKYNPYLLDLQLEWAARADWCVNTYENCNHAPVVTAAEKDITAGAGENVTLKVSVSDPDGDSCSLSWSVDPTGGIYTAFKDDFFTWTAEGEEVSFTVPDDAVEGDCFQINLRVRDDAPAVMTRYAQFMITVGSEAGDRELAELAEKQGLGLASVWNDRQLGGYEMSDGRHIRDGILLRSGFLYTLSEEDAETLCNKYHLKTVFDLRNEGEVNARPDVQMPGVTNIACTVYGTKDEEGFDNPVYIRYLATGTAKTGYKKLFDAWLQTEDGAFLWHCKSGKDRTGLSGMMILAALGADEDLIMKDFLLTNAVFEAEPDMDGAGSVKEEDLRLAIDYMKENYGSILGYVTEGLGVTEEEIETLRARCLE